MELKRHHQVYCKILSNVIKEAKIIYYDKKIQKSSSKGKTTWDVIKKVTNNQHSHTDIQELTIDSEHLKDQQDIAEAFNHYFLTIIDKTNKNSAKNKTNNEKAPTFHYYLEQNYVHPPPSLVIKTFLIKEITSIIKALKTKKLSWV